MSNINILTDRITDPVARNQKITPTLFIGLGGSGKRVLYQLRRLYFEKYGIPALPIMRFIYFDTDVNDLTTSDPDMIDVSIELDKSDIIDATIRQDEFDHLIKNLDGLYPYIAKWFDKQHLTQAATQGIMDGAKQIRALGRLSFFFKYDELERQIRTKINFDSNVKNESIRFLQERGVTNPEIDHDRVEIIVIGSLAGGTCSGTLIDTGFLSRKIGAGAQNASVTGIFFLPSAFSTLDGKKGFSYERAKANGYAALMELNYYMSPYLDDGNTTALEFEWKRDVKDLIPAPAYHVAYLLDNKNLKGRFDSKHEDVFNMAAEFLFLDYNESTFSTTKRSLHSNTNVVLGSNTYVQYNNSNYIQRFPNRFSSFGLSQIRLNIDKIKNASQSLIVSKLFERLLTFNELKEGWHNESDWIKFDFTEEIIIDRLSQYDSVNNFFNDEKKLINEGKDGVKGFSLISDTIISSKNKIKKAELDEFINVTIKDCNTLKRICQNSVLNRLAEGHIIGEGVHTIKQNRDIFKRAIKTKLEQEIIEKYLFKYKNHGINYASEFANIVLNQIKILIKNFNAYKGINITIPADLNFNDLPKVELHDLQHQVEKYRTLMEESHSLLPIPPKFKSTALEHFTSLYKRTEKQFEEEYTYQSLDLLSRIVMDKRNELITFIERSYKKKIANLFTPILDELDTFISELKTKLNSFELSTKSSKDFFYKYYESYKRTDANSRNNDLDLGWDDKNYIQNILQNADHSDFDEIIDKIWNNLLNKLREKNQVESIFIKLLNDAHSNQMNYKQEWKELERNILEITVANLSPFKIHGDINTAVQLFNKSFQETSSRKIELKDRIDFSSPRIQYNPQQDISKNLSSIALLGVDNKETEFIQEVQSISATEGFQAKQFSEDSIIFFQEIIGLPVFAIGGTDEFERSYSNLIRQDPSNLYKCHMEKSIDKYFELLLPETTEAHSRTLKYDPFLLGLILGDIVYDESSKRFVLLRQDNLGIKRKEPLSSSLVKSIHLLNDTQLNHLEREAGINGRRLSKMRSNGTEELFHLESTLYYLIDISNNVLHSIEFEGFKLNVLEKHLEDLYKKIRLKLYQSLQIPDAELLNTSDESLDVLAERYPLIREYKIKKERYLNNINSFTKTINYSDSRIKGNFRVLKS